MNIISPNGGWYFPVSGCGAQNPKSTYLFSKAAQNIKSHVISSLIYLGISGFFTTDCGMMSFIYLLLTTVAIPPRPS